MHTLAKCNCCCKESVCMFKVEYEADCKRIVQAISGRSTEVIIKCKEFMANQPLIKNNSQGTRCISEEKE